jgi:hypothetical protein
VQLLIVIDAPFDERRAFAAREWQFNQTALAEAVKLVASRIQLGVNVGEWTNNGIAVRFKTEWPPPAPADTGEAA